MGIIFEQQPPPTHRKSDMSIESLKGSLSQEHKFSRVAHRLMHGVEVHGHFVKLVKLNDAQSADDEAIYEIDFGISIDQLVVGYIDTERKPNWSSGNWPYPQTNIAKYPLSDWERGHFRGTLTNKLKRFRESPATSFWIGARADWEAYWILRAEDIFTHGYDSEQPTRYSSVPLPIIAVNNRYGTFCDSEPEFTEYILGELDKQGVTDA